jgi:hypothetical protein
MSMESHISTPPLDADFRRAPTLEEYLEGAQKNLDLWAAMRARARVPEEFRRRASALPGGRRLLVLLEDWCGDAVNTVPVLERLARETAGVELRVLGRDANPHLMDPRLTHGGRSIPVVIVLDEEGGELGWWGPRPSPLQRWVREVGLQLEPSERYREARRWYARDRGRTTLDEVLRIMERAGPRPHPTASPPEAGGCSP